MFCKHATANTVAYSNPSLNTIRQLVERFAINDVTDLLLEECEMGDTWLNVLGDCRLGYCAFGLCQSDIGEFAFRSFNGVEADELVQIDIYEFPKSILLSDASLLADAATDFASTGEICRKLSWAFRFRLPDDTLTDEIVLRPNDDTTVKDLAQKYCGIQL